MWPGSDIGTLHSKPTPDTNSESIVTVYDVTSLLSNCLNPVSSCLDPLSNCLSTCIWLSTRAAVWAHSATVDATPKCLAQLRCRALLCHFISSLHPPPHLAFQKSKLHKPSIVVHIGLTAVMIGLSMITAAPSSSVDRHYYMTAVSQGKAAFSATVAFSLCLLTSASCPPPFLRL